jgi:hypothetical protein
LGRGICVCVAAKKENLQVTEKGRRKGQREREEETVSVLTLTFGEYPCSWEKRLHAIARWKCSSL